MNILRKSKDYSQKPPGFWRRNWKKTWFKLLTVIVGIVGVAIIAWILTGYSMTRKIFTGNFSGASQILRLFSRTPDTLKGQNDGRINILLLGYGGVGHDGTFLTDTIQVLSLNTKSNQVSMISIPRDFYVDIKKPSYAGKINALYKTMNNGTLANKLNDCNPELIKREVSTILGIPIHYYASLDFNGFKKAVDQIGGIDVTVDRTFTDYEYPADTGSGFLPAQTFKAGFQHMNGAKALIYARSRHAAGAEGSDFARSQRQQKVLVAFKTRIMSQGMLDNPTKVLSLIDTISSSLRTDFQPTEIKTLASLMKTVDTSNMISKVLDDSQAGLLTQMPGSTSFQPRAGLTNFSQIQLLAKNIFDSSNIVDKSAKIVILNGSSTSGLSLDLRDYLTNQGYNITGVDKTTLTAKTAIYDFSNNSKKSTLDLLAGKLNTSVTAGSGKIINSWKADIIIVIGNDYQAKNGGLKESLKKQSGT